MARYGLAESRLCVRGRGICRRSRPEAGSLFHARRRQNGGTGAAFAWLAGACEGPGEHGPERRVGVGGRARWKFQRGAGVGAEEAAAPLVQQGWLLELPAPSKEATPVRLPSPETELLADAAVESARIGARAVLTFVFASVFAKLALRFWPFERVIRRVARRKAAHPDASEPLDIARARQLVDMFGRLRVFLFSHREKCLHDSLAQLEFLARYGVFPSWVFGVRARPFVAHCWVQYEDIVFNDTVEHVGGYAPIMVV